MSERAGVIFPFMILADAHFSHDTPRNSVLDLPFTCCSPARELGCTPPNRRASEVRCKTPGVPHKLSSVVMEARHSQLRVTGLINVGGPRAGMLTNYSANLLL